MTTLIWISTSLAALALALTAVNLLLWPRGRAGRGPVARLRPGGDLVRVSVLIPARNEGRNLDATLTAIAASRIRPDEVLVYNDASTDDTGAILERWAARMPELRIMNGDGLPSGWVGKPHACHRLGCAATGDVLLFVDADTHLDPDGIERVLDIMDSHRAALVTAVPHQRTGSWLEHLVVPLLHVTYTSWLLLPLIWWSRDPRFLAANGQVLAMTRAAWARTGGYESVRLEVVDDMAICRRAKEVGLRVVFADGDRIASCRMYRSSREVVDGFSKNLHEGLGGSAAALVLVILLYALAFVVPWVALAAGLLAGAAWWPVAAAGVVMNAAQRGALALRMRHDPRAVLGHPVGVVALLAIAINSWRWSRADRIVWAGRTYAARARRGTALPDEPPSGAPAPAQGATPETGR